MPLESATWVNQLDQTRPTATDVKSEGDDVMRLIKSTLKNSFPNVGGAMNASHTELNRLVGVTEDVQPRLSATLSAPNGETLNRLPAAASRLGGYLTFNATTGQPEVQFSIGQASANSVGIFKIGSDLKFFTSSIERLNIDGAGNAQFAGTVSLGRADATSEGGQVNFKRASDNTDAWAIDVVGTGSDTSLRFVNIPGAEAPLTMTQAGNLGMNISTPISTLGRSIHLFQGTNTATVADNATLRVQSLNRNGNVQISGNATSTNGLNFLSGETSYSAIVGEAVNSNLVFRTGGTTERMRIDSAGNQINRPSNTPPTLTVNGEMNITPTSNTNLRFSYRGSDGVTRVANLTLA
jgi:hypothetical protein